MQRLRDEPCATPMECYTRVIKALDEAEQEILSLKTRLASLDRTMTANHVQVNAGIQGLKTDMSTKVDSITMSVSTLATWPCNCSNDEDRISSCPSGKVSAGFRYYCKGSTCANSWTPVITEDTGIGITCCELCSGTAAEAEAYALANPVPPSRSI